MKIALCQINPTVGAFEKNKELIISAHDMQLVGCPDPAFVVKIIEDILNLSAIASNFLLSILF